MDKAIENQLQMSALEATADGVVITNCDGYILWANPAYSKMTGYSPQEVEGKHTRIHKSGRQNPDYFKALWATITSGNVWHGELWNRRKDGSHYLEEQSITPVLDSERMVKHFIAIKRDITNRYEWQQQLEQAQKMEAVGQLTAGIAHNFNNKLATIIGFTHLLREELENYNDEVMDDYIDEAVKAGVEARDLVRKLMSFCKENASTSKLLNLNDVLNESLKLLSSKLPLNIHLKTKVAHDIPTIKYDQLKIYQMLMCLVTNARDAIISEGNIKITIQHSIYNKQLCSSCHTSFSGEFVILSVSDTGQGISTENLNKIFLPYFYHKRNVR